jgi:hypothetical protein
MEGGKMPGVIETFAIIVSTLGTTTLAANTLYLGTLGLAYTGLAVGSQLLSGLFSPRGASAPETPKNQDGSYNLKQNVPPLSYVLGRVKKGGDYVFLEEAEGVAYHVICWAGHRIQGFATHYLHDKPVTLYPTGNVQTPSNFDGYVTIRSRVGLDAETAYPEITGVSALSSIWAADHRGDGLASVMMFCKGTAQKDYLQKYPNQMPQHSAIGDGALLYDPRKDTTVGGSGPHRYDDPNSWEFSTNLALMRLWHLCHPVGGKMSYERMDMSSWMTAADVCDEDVTNRSGGTEKRYHGGFWFRSDNDPVQVARYIDEAAELVVYQNAAGNIGVHPGKYVVPTVRLTSSEIFSIVVDKNQRKSSTVIAVRGRYVNANNDYNTEDSALYGDPYGEIDSNTQRTRTFDNTLVQSHNHCQRKQKLIFIRANARRVSVVADYDPARGAAYSRFVRIHYPTRGLVEALIEVTSSVSVDLRNMRVSFSGILVSPDLYSFDAATEEGSPGSNIPSYSPAGTPEPTGVSFSIENEVVSGGATAAYILAEWTGVSETLIYEVEYEKTSDSSTRVSVYSVAGEDSVRTGYLVDGEEYRVRIRAVGGLSYSDYSDYTTLVATADPVAPGSVSSVSATPSAGEVLVNWTSPGSANYYAARIYLGTVDNFGAATLVATEYGPPDTADSRTVTGLSADDYYGWVVAINSSGVSATEIETGVFTVT